MLPRLQAEERLNAITDGGVAAGSMERDDQKTVIAALTQAAEIERPKTMKASPALLAEMGIALIGAASG